MTNENWIRTQLPTAKLAQMILYHDCTEEYDCNYDEEWEFRGLRDVWVSHDGREFDDLDEAISYEFDWLTSQFEGGIRIGVWK